MNIWPQHSHRFQQTVLAQLAHINQKLETITMSQQDIDAAVAAETALVQDIATQTASIASAQQAFAAEIANLNAEIATLQAGGVNTDALNAITTQLTAAQGTLDTAVTALAGASQPPASA